MARQRYRGNTLSAAFPLISSFCGQTIIINGIDQYYMQGASKFDQDIGIPSVIFMENVMPMMNGLQSVGYTKVVQSQPSAEDFDQAFYLRDSAEFRTLFVPASGKNYLYDFLTGKWRTNPYLVPYGTTVSTANVKSRQFVCYARNGVFEWDGVNLLSVTLAGVDSTKIFGIVEANTYLVAYTESEILWSSIFDPLDFVPALETGAGASKVLSLKGPIVYCTPISDGFMIYTTANTVASQYTANSRFPWTFKEIAGSKGIDDPKKVTHDSTDIKQYAMTVAGLMGLDRTTAAIIWPEVTNFLAGRRYEIFDYVAKKVKEVNLYNGLLTKINYISARYFVISYGENELTHALIFDSGLKRWGKVQINHVDCFEFIDLTTIRVLETGQRYIDVKGTYAEQELQYWQYGQLVAPIQRYIDVVGTYADQYGTYESFGGKLVPGTALQSGQEPLKGIGFLQKDGTVQTLNFDLPNIEIDSVLYLGRYQLNRNRLTTLHEVWIEQVSGERTSNLSLIKSMDGMNDEEPVYLYNDTEVSKNRLQKYLANSGPFMNCVLRFDGNFDLSSLEMVFSPAGYR